MRQPTNGSSYGSSHGSSHSSESAGRAPPGAATVKNTRGNDRVDAGLRSLNHYRRALPRWRYNLRQSMLPLVRWETPYLAYLQSKTRTPFLDAYFAVTANLGTHTFFMIGLPVLFWCGLPGFGRGLVHILASGVFFSGFVKDLCSLPRPLSPPLHRITMSGSVALEYGFPSTHSANAVSVAVYVILLLRSGENTFSPTNAVALEVLSYFYALSIVVGRLYCGMHGFLDVIVGSVMGAVISMLEFHYGPWLEEQLYASSYVVPLCLALTIIILVRVHPEPADDCPCFDDSIAFAGVMIGLEFGMWHLAHSPELASIYNGPDATLDLATLGWPIVIARIASGVILVFVWREVMKPTLLCFLPHLFRVFEQLGLLLPRRFFMSASKYNNVPLRIRDDNILPNMLDFPKLVRSFKGPTRGRSVSIGPQSAADAYETLAYRERRRRESNSDAAGARACIRGRRSLLGMREDATASEDAEEQAAKCSQASGMQTGGRIAAFEKKMGQGTVLVENGTKSSPWPTDADTEDDPDLYVGQQDELGEKEMFSRLPKPRVRYDVEVVTKLVVYSGIALLAVDMNLVIFQYVGLGTRHLS